MPYQNYQMGQAPFAQIHGGYQQPQQPPSYGMRQEQPVHGFVYVTGIEGAKAYYLPPNSEMPLFDNGGDILYIKTTDGAGFPTITIVDCTKRDSGAVVQQNEYVTREEVDRIYGDLTSQVEQLKGAVYASISTTAAVQPDAQQASGIEADGKRGPARHVSAAHAE